MDKRALDKRLSEFIELLMREKELYESLLQAVRGKLSGMRSGQIDLLNSWVAREEFLVSRIKDLDSLIFEYIKEISSIVGKDKFSVMRDVAVNPPLQVGSDKVSSERKMPNLRIRELAEDIDEPYRSRILTLSEAIRCLAEEIKTVNEIVGEISYYMVDMFYQIRKELAGKVIDPGIYRSDGKRADPDAIKVLDAVG